MHNALCNVNSIACNLGLSIQYMELARRCESVNPMSGTEQQNEKREKVLCIENAHCSHSLNAHTLRVNSVLFLWYPSIIHTEYLMVYWILSYTKQHRNALY